MSTQVPVRPTAPRGLRVPSGSFALVKLRESAWPVALVVLFAALLAWQATHIRAWGAFELQTMFTSTLPIAFLTLAQAVIVIGGGIDLSVGAQMVLFNCVSAWLMKDVGFAGALGMSAVTLLLGVLLGVLTAWVVTTSGIPDIIVTLATSFVWLGLALVVMPAPGGGADPAFQALVQGGPSSYWPALVVLAVPMLLVLFPLRRTRAGLAVFALGSNPQAAFLAGVSAGRARMTAYAFGGFFAALAGLATTAYTGGGAATPSVANVGTLASVAGIVLGGVALTGGVGGFFGPVVAVWCLFLVSSNLLVLGVDPSWGEVVRGVIIVVVVLVGSLLRARWSRS
ncbi:MAG: ABC transporter permease [Actinomycetota bacterium]|nr:ABC transporter permease [Actinomycetota bacterium]